MHEEGPSGPRQKSSGGSLAVALFQAYVSIVVSELPPDSSASPTNLAGSSDRIAQSDSGPGSFSCTPKPPGDALNESSKIEWPLVG